MDILRQLYDIKLFSALRQFEQIIVVINLIIFVFLNFLLSPRVLRETVNMMIVIIPLLLLVTVF